MLMSLRILCWVVAGCCVLPQAAFSQADREDNKEEIVRKHLQRLADSEKAQNQERMERLIEDVNRVTPLSAEQEERLLLASKGAVDAYLTSWRQQMERWVRDRVNTVEEEIDEFLANMGSVRFGNAKDWAPELQPIWVDAVRETLTDSQRRTYCEDLELRAVFKHKAMAQVAVADLDARIRLSPKQRTALLPLVEEASASYWERLQSWSGTDDNIPFHYLGAILGGIPEETLQKHLTEPQLKAFQQYFSNFSGVWNRIQQMDEPVSFHSLLD